MRALRIPATLVLALPCAAQFQALPVPATPDLVFTLKKPTRYELPKAVQNMIMCSLKQVPMIRKGQVRTTHQPNGWSAAAFIEGIFGVVA